MTQPVPLLSCATRKCCSGVETYRFDPKALCAHLKTEAPQFCLQTTRCQQDTANGANPYDNEGRRAPRSEKHEADERYAEIPWSVDGTRPHWIVQRRAQQSHDRGVDAAHHRLRARTPSEGVPERHDANKYQNPWKK